MPIVVQCACGGKFQAKDELAGKRLNCPSCKSPIQVPNPQANRQAAKPANGEMAVQCQCGQKFKAKSEMAGKKAKCPKCQSPILIPGGKAPATPAAKQPAAGAGKINVQCTCGQVYSVPATMAGRAVKCQKCGAGMKVPGGATAPAQPQAAAADPLSDPLGMGDLGGTAGGDLFADDPLGGDFGNDLGGDAFDAPAASGPTFQPGAPQPAGAAPTQAAGGSKMTLPLIIGLASGGGVLLLLLICGIGGYFLFATGGSGPAVASTDDGSPSPTDGANPDPTDTPFSETTDGSIPETTDGEAPAPVDPPTDGNDKTEPVANGDLAKDILGYWKLELIDGKEPPPSNVNYMLFKEDVVTMLDLGAPALSLPYELDATKSPAHYDFVPSANVPLRLKGIARIKDDRLELCQINSKGDIDPESLGNRPKDFVSEKGFSVLIATRVTDQDLIAQLQGDKKPPAEPVAIDYIRNGKRMSLAVMTYDDVNNKLPRNRVNKQGEVLFSWRVEMLPFMEYSSEYQAYNKDARWDQPDNMKLTNEELAKRVTIYKAEYSQSPLHTSWKYIPDTKTGIMLVLGSEDAPQVIWTQPDEIKPDLNDLKATFGTAPEEGYVVILTNGAAERMSEAELKTALSKAETWDMKGKPR